jgi:carboxypeptidase Q
MKKFTILFLIVLLSTYNITYSQQDPVVQKIIEIGKTDNQSMHHLDILTNRFGGRPIGSDAYENAAEWAAYKFKQWGMEVEMDEVGELPVGFNRGPWFGKLLGENAMDLHFATPSYTSGTKGVQRGHVLIEPKTQSQFDAMKGKLKGAWVLVTGHNNGFPIDWSSKGDSIRAEAIKEEYRNRKRELGHSS